MHSTRNLSVVVTTALTLLSAGCFSPRSATSGQIGCREREIRITDDSTGWSATRTWTALCKGKRYFCSQQDSDVNCTEESTGSETPAATAAPAAVVPTAAAQTGCQYDTQCKHDRICEDGRCVSPTAPPAPPSPPAPAATPESGASSLDEAAPQ